MVRDRLAADAGSRTRGRRLRAGRGSRETHRLLEAIHARNAGIVWQSGFFDHRLRGDESRNEKISYIRQNPVRKGLVTEPEAWPHAWPR